jgi:alpha-D-ribose 1-methylphosphonate 5-triphosphate diphosphatase PhnM
LEITKTETEIKTNTKTKTVETFVNNAGYVNKGTAREYRKRLKLFAQFVSESYNSITLDELVETLTIMGHGPKVDVYQLFSKYIGWLQQRGNMSPRSIKTWVSTARHYLETLDVEI